MTPPVWFLAHPVAGDEHYSLQENLVHIQRIAQLCFRVGVSVVAPYYLTCLVFDDDAPAQRELGMAANDAVIRGLGRLLMVGHTRSFGMQRELALVTSLPLYDAWDCVGVPDMELAEHLIRTRHA